MNALKIIKKIESDKIQIKGLEEYIGSDAEIIILINSGDSSRIEQGRNDAFTVISKFKGHLKSWSRNELYER